MYILLKGKNKQIKKVIKKISGYNEHLCISNLVWIKMNSEICHLETDPKFQPEEGENWFSMPIHKFETIFFKMKKDRLKGNSSVYRQNNIFAYLDRYNLEYNDEIIIKSGRIYENNYKHFTLKEAS